VYQKPKNESRISSSSSSFVIVDSNIKEFNLKYDLTMMRSLLLCCNRVVVNKYGVEIKNNLIKLLNNFDQTIIDLDYICNFDKVMVEDIVKNKEILEYYVRGSMILDALGYTDHSVAHTKMVAERAACLMECFF
jgi:hypothetical protein